MAGVTDAGWVGKTEQEIKAEYDASVKSTISPSLDTSVNSVIGRLIAILAAARAEDWETLEAVYNSQYEQATGQSLDYVMALTGTAREEASASTVTATVNMDSATAVTAGQIIASVDGNPNAQFANVAAFTAPSTGDHDIEFAALETGPIAAPSGTLTVLEVAITGVNSITNALDADPGANIEDDAPARVRRRSELTAQGTGTEKALRADVAQVADVESVEIIVNRTSGISGVLPPHSFELVVFGGDDDAIAQAIWDGMPSGITNFGSSSGDAVDAAGVTRETYFSRPTEIRVYVDITLTTDPDTYAGDAAVQSAIAKFADGTLQLELPNGTVLDGELNVGDDVIVSRLYSAVNSVAGVVSISSIKVGTSPSPTLSVDIEIDPREIVAVSGVNGIQTADVSVTSS